MAQLSPEEMQVLQEYFQKNPGAAQYVAGNGMRYAPQYSTNNTEDPTRTLAGYSTAQGEWRPGQQAQAFDPSGRQTAQWTAEDPNKKSWVDVMPLAIGALATGGMLGMIGPGIGSAAAAGGAGAASMGGYGTGGLLTSAGTAAGGAAGSGGVLSKAALDGTTAFGANSVPGAYELGGGSGLLDGTGFDSGAFDGGGGDAAEWMQDAGPYQGAAKDSQLYNASIPKSEALAGYSAAGNGGVYASPTMAGGTNWLQDLAGSILPNAKSPVMALGSMLGGGLLGSKGETDETQWAKRMDPRLDPYVYGENGLLPKAANLLASQTTPEAQQGWKTMQSMGQGLLTQPMAGNGFEKFAARRLK